MINNFTGVGRTTNDIDLRYSQNGTAVANFTLAITRRFDKEKADFIRCVAFKKTAELLAEYVKKGHQLAIEGTVQTGHYDDKDGKRVYTTDVIVNNMQFLESKDGQQSGNAGQFQQQAPQQQQNNPFQGQGDVANISDQDLPF